MPGYRALQNSSRFRLRLLIVENNAFQVAVPLHDLVQMQSVIRVRIRIRIRNSSSSSTRIGALLCAHVRMCDRFVCGSGRREGRIALSHVLFSLSLAFVREVSLVSLGKCLQTSKPISFIIIRSTRKYIPSEQKQQSARGEQSVLRLAFFFFSRRERAFSKRTHTHIRERDI